MTPRRSFGGRTQSPCPRPPDTPPARSQWPRAGVRTALPNSGSAPSLRVCTSSRLRRPRRRPRTSQAPPQRRRAHQLTALRVGRRRSRPSTRHRGSLVEHTHEPLPLSVARPRRARRRAWATAQPCRPAHTDPNTRHALHRVARMQTEDLWQAPRRARCGPRHQDGRERCRGRRLPSMQRGLRW